VRLAAMPAPMPGCISRKGAATLPVPTISAGTIVGWRRHYNEARPHSALGYLPPATFAAMRWGSTLRVIGHSAPRPIAPGAEAVIPMKPLTF
jgi:Integrase core domain